MGNGEFLGSAENNETLRERNQHLGHEANESVADERERLLKRKAELEAKLRAAGVDLTAPTEKLNDIVERKRVEAPAKEPMPAPREEPEPTPKPDYDKDWDHQFDDDELEYPAPAQVAEKAKRNKALRKLVGFATVAAALTAAAFIV